jgi:tryptophanyl-tRNA synthetase
MEKEINEKINIEDVVPDKSKRILTGDRPTGHLHIGHYFGSLKSRVELQDKFETFIEVADVQALTDNFNNPDKVRENVMQVVMDEISVGIDPNKVTFFIQSEIPEIAELTVYYSNLVTISRLQRNPTVKTEIAQKKDLFGDGESVTYGFLGYPVSQAADITAFEGTYVPVGEDQLPLIEQCREIVRKFNSIYGETLKEPTAIISGNPRIKGLDGNVKMGKSLGNALYLSDSEDIVREKVRNAKTDPARIKKDDPGHPDVCMVYYYHNLFTDKETCNNICQECKAGCRGCVACKEQLMNSINNTLNPIREKRRHLEENPNEVKEILRSGTEHARKIAQETMSKVKKSMKLDYDI